MINKQILEQETELVQTLENFAQAYEEISVVRMQRVRGSVLITREFISELTEIFGQIKTSYHNLMVEAVTQQKSKFHFKSFGFLQASKIDVDMSMLNRNGKTVNILISADSKLHGDIVKRSFRFFIDSVINDTAADVVIVGRIGREMFETAAPGKPYQYFDIPETNVRVEDLKPLMAYILQYGRTNFYYGQFNNMVKQAPTMTNISGEVEEQEQAASQKNTKARFVANGQTINSGNSAGRRYIFEPSVDKIIEFFNSEVFSSFVMQAFHESELARLASRVNAMEQALSNIDREKGNLKVEDRQLRRRAANKKQLDAISGLSLWMK